MGDGMAVALTKENFFWHKLHSLTGVLPVGAYMVQHLSLNSFSIAGEAKFNGVIHFFDSIPKHVLLTVEALLIWLPLLFHSVYGLFITNRGKQNFIGTKYGWTENRMFLYQRVTGILLFLFLLYHVLTTTVAKYLAGHSEMIEFAAWHHRLTENGYIILVVYLLGVTSASYHLAYGIWNFCIRWGITISEAAQRRVQRFSFVMFIALTLLGWGSLAGFILNRPASERTEVHRQGETPLPPA